MSTYTYNDVPTDEQKAADLAFLLTTNIPYGYRAAVWAEGHAKTGGTRPSNAKIAWAHTTGTVTGYENAVKDLFRYFFHGDARDLLQQAVDSIEPSTPTRPWPRMAGEQ